MVPSSLGLEQQRGRFAIHKERVYEIGVLGDSHAVLALGESVDFRIRSTVAVRQIKGVDRVVTRFAQTVGKTTRELCIDQKSHAATDSIRFTWLSRAAKVSTARMSAYSRSG